MPILLAAFLFYTCSNEPAPASTPAKAATNTDVPSATTPNIDKRYVRMQKPAELDITGGYRAEKSMADNFRERLDRSTFDQYLRLSQSKGSDPFNQYTYIILREGGKAVIAEQDMRSGTLNDSEDGSYTIDRVNKTISCRFGSGELSSSETFRYETQESAWGKGTITNLVSMASGAVMYNTSTRTAPELRSPTTTPTAYNSPSQTSQRQVERFSDEAGVFQYLMGNRFRHSNGAVVTISTYDGVAINGRQAFFNLEITVLSSTRAVIRGESVSNPDGMVTLYLDTTTGCLDNSGDMFCL